MPTTTHRPPTAEARARAIETAPDAEALIDLVFGDLTGPDLDKQDALYRLIRHNTPCVSRKLHDGQPDQALDAAERIAMLYELAPDCDLTDDQSAALYGRMLTTAALLDRVSDLPCGQHAPEEWYRRQIARATELRNRILALIEARPEEIADAVRRLNLDPSLTVLAKP